MLFAQTLILAAEGEGGGGLDLLLPATNELIAGIIAFAIVFFFIRLWAWPAIDRSLENRRQAISGQLEDAEKAKVEAETLLEDYRKQMEEARAKGAEIIEEARVTAEQLKSDIVAKANAEAEQIVAKAREEGANLSIDLAERVVGQSLDRETQLGLVQRYLAELEQM